MSTARLPNPTMLSRPEADLVRRDGALPGLAMALDAEALLAALVVWVFPNDLRLRVLRRLADQKTRLDLLRHMLPERPDLWGGTLRTLRYKPERRYVAQLETTSGARLVLKAHAAPRYERAAI